MTTLSWPFVFNLLLMVGASTTIIKFDAAYIYASNLRFSLITKEFFDPRLGLFIHVLAVVLIGFIVLVLNMSFYRFWLMVTILCRRIV